MELPRSLSKDYNPGLYERECQRYWDELGIYRFDPAEESRPPYSIDTPPPYPSGEFHMGNALNWCYIDFAARYKRMRGFNVHFPQGWDCHGLPTEVRAESTYKVRKRDLPPERFKELCIKLTNEYIESMRKAMKAMGYSIDWGLEYKTMDPLYFRLTQLSFLELYRKGLLYRGEHPVNWCPRCETAIAEAEVEHVMRSGRLYYVEFGNKDRPLLIATTRPELLYACVAVAVNPSDDRYAGLSGGRAKLPLFDREVPVICDEGVDPTFGTGIVMVCTFGDKMDARWQKKHNLPIVRAITEDGRTSDDAGPYKGLTLDECRGRVVADLEAAGLLKKSEEVERNIGTCWRCHSPVEILAKPQWFMKTREMTDRLIEAAEHVVWIPDFAKSRLIDWAKSLDWDWVISRQRIFATPIPVWYCKKCGQEIVAEEGWLPIDPRFEPPKLGGCPRCGSRDLTGETDVMDTWMDSSITCAVHAGWPTKMDLFRKLFPADLQPNGVDIIRTWDYYLMVKHLAMFGRAPYKTVLVNGMVRGADGRMMHKSFGNYVEVSQAIDKYGADAVRQWAASGASTGYDIPFKWSELEYGRRFLTKLWNASRFIIDHLKDYEEPHRPPSFEPLDQWVLSKLERTIRAVTQAMEEFQFNSALESIRAFTWHVFCDHYLEAVKYRLYSADPSEQASKRAAHATLGTCLDAILRLLAPICPHVTETIFRILHRGAVRSIHVEPWPEADSTRLNEKAEKVGDTLVAAISSVRRMKSERRMSLKAPLKHLTIYADDSILEEIRNGLVAVRRVCHVDDVVIAPLTQAGSATGYPDLPQVKISVEF